MPESKHRILVALPRGTREQFLPDWNPVAWSGLEILEPDMENFKAGGWADYLREQKPEVLLTGWGSPAVPDEPDLSLKYVCHLAGSVRFLVSRKMIERGLLVSNWGNSISYCIAEHAVLLVLGALRRVPLWRAAMEDPQGTVRTGKTFKERIEPKSLRGRRVGIHGFGAVVRELIPMLRAFRVEIAVYSEGVSRNLIEAQGVACCESLEKLFSSAEVLIECEALSPRSLGSVTGDILRRLGEGAVFVNVGRGAVVDEAALAKMAAEKKWRVGLDVFVGEPLPGDSPLLALEGVLLSPHIAGPTPDVFGKCGDFALANVGRYLSGLAPEGLITPEIYDRST